MGSKPIASAQVVALAERLTEMNNRADDLLRQAEEAEQQGNHARARELTTQADAVDRDFERLVTLAD